MTKKKGTRYMVMSEFSIIDDVFSDGGIRCRCAPNHFQRVQNRYCNGSFVNSDGRIFRVFSTRRSRITYGKTLISHSNRKMSFGHLRKRGR